MARKANRQNWLVEKCVSVLEVVETGNMMEKNGVKVVSVGIDGIYARVWGQTKKMTAKQRDSLLQDQLGVFIG